jgi:hypothetical protein
LGNAPCSHKQSRPTGNPVCAAVGTFWVLVGNREICLH